MAGTKKLGKGLKALISDEITFNDEGEMESGEDGRRGTLIIELETNRIRPNTGQPRQNFDKAALEEMAVSIKEHGILQPLVVRPEGKGYTIIAGERRWRAANIAGLKEVPVIVKDLPARDVMEIALIENVQRENLNPIEEAMAYEKLMDEYNMTQGEIGIKIGKSRASVTNVMRLLNLPDGVRQMILDNQISQGHARRLLTLEDDERISDLAHRIVDEDLSVREVEKMTEAPVKKKKPKKKTTVTVTEVQIKDQYVLDVEEKLTEKFSTKVSVYPEPGDKKGTIVIQYYSPEDFNRLLELMQIDGR